MHMLIEGPFIATGDVNFTIQLLIGSKWRIHLIHFEEVLYQRRNGRKFSMSQHVCCIIEEDSVNCGKEMEV